MIKHIKSIQYTMKVIPNFNTSGKISQTFIMLTLNTYNSDFERK